MQLLSSSFRARSAQLTKTFLGSDVIKVGNMKFSLPDDIARSQIAGYQDSMTGLRMLLIVILAITIIGIILAIPLYFAAKRKRLNMAFETRDGYTFTVASSSNAESKILQKYAGIGTFDS